MLQRCDRAHPEVASLITQVLESGQLTDSMGKRCDFRNAVVVLTTSPASGPLPSHPGGASSGGSSSATEVVSGPGGHGHPEAHAGASGRHASGHSAAAMCLSQPGEGGGGGGASQAQAAAPHPLRYVASELLARLDAAVDMQPLSEADMQRILQLQLGDLQGVLAPQGVRLRVDDAAQRWLAARGLSPVSGAQRLQPLLREQLLLPLADALLDARLHGGDAGASVRVTACLAADGSRLVIAIE